MTELEKQEKEVQRMREQQEFSLLRVRLAIFQLSFCLHPDVIALSKDGSKHRKYGVLSLEIC